MDLGFFAQEGGQVGGGNIDYAALGTGGGLIGGLTSFYQPFISQNWASNASSRDWERTKWAWKWKPSYDVKALERAGLNPILAAGGGGFGGGMNVPLHQSPGFDVDGDAIGRGVSTGLQAAETRQNLKILREQAQQEHYKTEQERENVFITHANSAAAAATAKIVERNRDLLNATLDTDIATRKANLTTLQQNLELQRTKLPSAKAQAEFDESPAGQTLNYLRRIVDVVRP